MQWIETDAARWASLNNTVSISFTKSSNEICCPTVMKEKPRKDHIFISPPVVSSQPFPMC